MKNAILITAGLVTGVVAADLITKGAVHATVMEAIHSLRNKGEEIVDETAEMAE